MILEADLERYRTRGWPRVYLHVRHISSGEEWVQPLRGNAALNLRLRVRRWLREEFAGELALDGDIMPRLDGEYYAQIMTDGRAPDAGVCWSSGGFYTVTTY